MPTTDRKTVDAVKRWCQRHHPSAGPVRIRLVPAQRLRQAAVEYGCDCPDYGLTIRSEDWHFTVLLRADLSHEKTVDTLLHEWAHVLRLHMPCATGDTAHDDIYAAIDGRIRRTYNGESHGQG
jgi:hypothetical protein